MGGLSVVGGGVLWVFLLGSVAGGPPGPLAPVWVPPGGALPPAPAPLFPHHAPGRVLFAEWASEEAIELRVEAGATVRGTRLSASFGWDDYRHRNPDALVLALVRDGRPLIAAAADRLQPKPGDVVISLVFPVAA